MTAVKINTDMEGLIELFLTPEFDPLKQVSTPDLSKHIYEGEVSDGEQDVADGDDDEFVNYKDIYRKQCGRKLARLGDEFLKSHTEETARTAQCDPVDTIRNALNSFVDVSSQQGRDTQLIEREKERAWETFKGVMSCAVTHTGVDDAYKELGAFLLTLHGLSNLGSGVRIWARRFSLRFIEERQLDRSIQRMGGLDALMEQELD